MNSTTTTERDPELFFGAITWDDHTAAKEAAHLPLVMRDDYLWLKRTVRRAYARHIQTVADLLAGLGFAYDKSTWSKILRGNWGRDAKGNAREPVMPVDEFCDAVRALRAKVRVDEASRRQPFVLTESAQGIMNYVAYCRSPRRPNRFGLICGDTGMQKSFTLEEVARRDEAHVRYAEAPENGARGALLQILAGDMSGQNNAYKLEAHLLTATGPEDVIILDNVQHLIRVMLRARKRGSSDQPPISFLRRFQDVTKCTLILDITPDGLVEANQLGRYWEQIVGRCGGMNKIHRLPDFPPEIDLIQFAAAYRMEWAQEHLARIARLEPGPAKDPHRLAELSPALKPQRDYLIRLSRQPGFIRPFCETLWEASILAGNGPLKFKDLQEVGGPLDLIPELGARK